MSKNANEVIRGESESLQSAVREAIQKIHKETGLTVRDIYVDIDTIYELGGKPRTLVRSVRITTET